MHNNTKYIIITGPESTGKSTLTRDLAAQYNCPYVPEYAREYLAGIKRPYNKNDLLQIARMQWERQLAAMRKSHEMVICDTGFLVMKVWSEFVFGRCDPWILKMLNDHKPDLYLLCDIDLPWENDPLREHPQRRDELLTIYRKELEALEVPWSLVSGQEPGARLAAAKEAIE